VSSRRRSSVERLSVETAVESDDTVEELDKPANPKLPRGSKSKSKKGHADSDSSSAIDVGGLVGFMLAVCTAWYPVRVENHPRTGSLPGAVANDLSIRNKMIQSADGGKRRDPD
jgi:hypothetical protein